jgi:hypothetical protein
MTNATKANLIAVLNAGLGLLIAFDVVLSTAQQGAIVAVANTVLALWVSLTYKDSAKRIADA